MKRGAILSDIPASIKVVFDQLSDEVMWMHTKWVNHTQLFRSSEKRRKMLTECASTFFFIVHNVLIDDAIMSLSKLTEPAGSGNRRRLSFARLQKEVRNNGDRKLADELSRIVQKLDEKGQLIRAHRNKRIAHLDLQTAINKVKLDKISVEMIEEMLALTVHYMNAIQGHYYHAHVEYGWGITSVRDADALISKLKDALQFRELIRDGKIPSAELFQSEWHDA